MFKKNFSSPYIFNRFSLAHKFWWIWRSHFKPQRKGT